jgi:hypothetical protein
MLPPAGGVTVDGVNVYDTPYGTCSRVSETPLENCPSEVTVAANWFEYPNPMTCEKGEVETANVVFVVTSRATLAESAKPPPEPDIVSWYVFVGVEAVVETTIMAYPSPSAGGITVLGVKTTEIELGRLA